MATESLGPQVFAAASDAAAVAAQGWRFGDIDAIPPGWQLVFEGGELKVRNERSVATFGIEEVLRRINGQRLAIAKACRGARRVHDALAGWGTDALTLALLGMDVVATERDPRVFAVLKDRIMRAREIRSDLSIECRQGDGSGQWVASSSFDLIYLDPMFQAHPTTALAGASMQALASWAQPAALDDLAAMLDRARANARVVVKRRRKDPPLAPADWSIKAKAIRFDVYRPR